MPKLVITEGEGTREVGLKSGDTLGRTSQNAVQLKVAEASRNHCRFVEEKGAWFIEDLGSSNGTQVNGRRVTKFELQDGDVVQIGKVSLRFLDAPLEDAPVISPTSWGTDDLSLEDQVFLVLGGAGRSGDVIPLPEGTVSVGRNAKHVIVLKDASVSGDHAEIRREGSTCTLKDLGSSNGTFINGRRVAEGELASGDVVRFGSIEATFGVGDPKDFAPPEPAVVSAGSGEVFTKLMPVADLGDDPTFQVHDLPRSKETLWNIVAFAVILLLAGGVGFLVLRGGRAAQAEGPRALSRGSNLLPEWVWSFEVPEGEVAKGADLQGWAKEDLGDPTDMGEVSDPVRSGHFAWRVGRTAPSADPSFALLNVPVTVPPGAALKLSAEVTGDGAIPVLAAVWMELRKEGDEEAPVEVTRDLVFGEAAGKEWKTLEGLVFAPEGASLLRVGVGGAGSGGVVLDDVRVMPTDPPAGFVREVLAFKAVLEAQGTVRLSRYGRRLVEGLGVAVKDGDRVLSQEHLFARDPGSGGEGRLSGTLRGGRGDLRVALESGSDDLRFRLEGPGLAAAGLVMVPLVFREGGDLQVTTLDGDQAKSYSQSFAGQQATALIVGSGSDRAKIHFLDGAGQALKLETSFTARAGRGDVLVGVGAREQLVLDFQLSFAKEEQAAREILARANQAVREKRGGEALLACEEIMARFPFEAKVMEEASKIHGQVTAEARARADALRTRFEDATFFRTLAREDVLAKALAEEKARYAGHPLGEEFAKIDEALQAALKAWAGPRREAEASRILARGKDYLDGGKAPLAALFFAAVSTSFSGTDEADQADAFLKRLKETPESGAKEK